MLAGAAVQLASLQGSGRVAAAAAFRVRFGFHTSPPSLLLLQQVRQQPQLPGNSGGSGSMDSEQQAEEAWQRVTRGMEKALARHGLDIVAPFSVAWYNSVVPPALRLSWLGRTRPPLGVIVGNSRALWSPFLESLRADPGARQQENPLNAYIKRALDEALSPFHVLNSQLSREAGGASQDRPAAYVYWAHETAPGKLVAMQRLAHVSAIAYFDEDSHLCVHPEYGPWFAMRAVVVLDLDPPKIEPKPLANLLDDEAQARVKAAMRLAMEQPRAAQHDDCGSRTKSWRSMQHDMAHWKLWLAVRDAIAPDHPWRYSQEQIEYHYTGNRLLLDNLVSGHISH